MKTPADLLENWSLSWQGVGLAESALGDPWVSRASGHWVDMEFVVEIIPVLNRRAGKLVALIERQRGLGWDLFANKVNRAGNNR